PYRLPRYFGDDRALALPPRRSTQQGTRHLQGCRRHTRSAWIGNSDLHSRTPQSAPEHGRRVVSSELLKRDLSSCDEDPRPRRSVYEVSKLSIICKLVNQKIRSLARLNRSHLAAQPEAVCRV